MVLFLKRLRKRFGEGIRFFQCGEYGEKYLRPHHHALLFNCGFPDARKLHGDSELSSSQLLEELWGHGLCSIGELTFESAGYVARYSMKKLGQQQLAGRVPPYLTMSRRPGIGADFIERHQRQVAKQDFIVINGHQSGVPRFYRDRLSKSQPQLSMDAKIRRRGRAASDPDNTGQRLIIRETVKQASIKTLSRTLE